AGFEICAAFAFADDEGAVNTKRACSKIFVIRAGNYHTSRWYTAFIFDRRGLGYVNNFCRLCEHNICSKHSLLFNDHAFHNDAAAADKTTILDNDRRSLYRLEYATDTNAAAQVNSFTYLRTTADGCPGIHH